MKINSVLGMLVAVAAIATTTASGNATSADAQHKYSDDAIVRDLKAGKLTVREAQMLQDRKNHAAPATASAAPKPPIKPIHPAHAVKPGKSAKSVKPAKHGKSVKSKAKRKGNAPVSHLANSHDKDKKKARPAAAAAPAAHPKATRTDKSATRKPEPVRKTAVKYIR